MCSPRKVLIIHPEGNTFNNPTLKCIVDLLKENGVVTGIRYCKSLAPMPTVDSINLFPYGRFHKIFRKIIFDKLSIKSLINFYVRAISLNYSHDHDLVIGVDRSGVIEAAALGRILNIPCIFFSFEIMFEAETGKRFKEIERNSVCQIKHWFVQDEVRKQCLINEDYLSEDNCITLPVASAGLGTFYKQRLRDDIGGIAGEKKVAILIGTIADWTMAKEIVESVPTWPDNWVLIVHNRYGDTRKALSKLKVDPSFLSAKNIFISNYPSDMVDDMGYILNGVSAGITFYKPNFKNHFLGNNLRYMGLSSGKINTCLRYGVPVIMNNIGLYSMLATEKKIGFVASSPMEIGKALEMLELNETEYRNGAIDFFSSTLDFNNFRQLVWGKISCTEKV